MTNRIREFNYKTTNHSWELNYEITNHIREFDYKMTNQSREFNNWFVESDKPSVTIIIQLSRLTVDGGGVVSFLDSNILSFYSERKIMLEL